MRSLRLLRRGALAIWSVMFVLLLATVLVSHAFGLMGHRTFIIRGGSMEPTIPLGSLVAIGNVSADEVRIGDVITLKDGDRPVFTHRVVRFAHADDGTLLFITKGDANAQEDGQAIPITAVMGRVDLHVPYLGYLLALLSMPTGMVSVLCGMASVLSALMLLEEDERETRARQAAGLPPEGAEPGLLPDPHSTPSAGLAG